MAPASPAVFGKTRRPRMLPWRLLALCSVTLLAACSSAHPCRDAKKDGGLCVGPREIYGLTDDRDQINPNKQTLKAQAEATKLLDQPPSAHDQLPLIDGSSGGYSGGNSGNQFGQSTNGVYAGTGRPNGAPPQALAAATGSGSLGETLNNPRPLITQPKVMRVWVAPYVGRKGDLHVPGYAFVVVHKPRWRFSVRAVHHSVVLTPLQVGDSVGMTSFNRSQTAGSAPGAGSIQRLSPTPEAVPAPAAPVP
ncbi:MAG: type IV conjugative transfer system lipoprotein TraV [Acidiphilium sp.]|nr:type IV conjugative transfer system lipoprotein TraV [Acidiphilium sp.]